MEQSRWHRANLLLPVSQAAREGREGVSPITTARLGVCVRLLHCLKTLAVSASTLTPHSLHISGVEWRGGGQKLAQTSTVAS